MGYIDQELGIKSARSLQKYIIGIVSRDVIVIKTDGSLKLIWAIGDKLETYNIDAHVIYTVQEEQVKEAINAIKNSLK